MPSHSVKQAKTMSAIAHGWKPKGSAKHIPVGVAKEFHAADKGKKYGKGHHGGHYEHRESHGHHGHEEFRTPHHSPHVGNNDGYAGKLEQHFTGKGDGRHGGGGNLEHHAKQPHGRKGKEMVGFAEGRHTEGTHDSYHAEQVEHWGKQAKHGGGVSRGVGTTRPHGHGGHHAGNPGNTRHHAADHGHGHSELAEKAGMGHAKKYTPHPSGGPGDDGHAEHHRGHVMKHEHDTHESVTHEPMTAHVFKNPMGGEKHGYGHNTYQHDGFLRNSGHKGAHRIGRK